MMFSAQDLGHYSHCATHMVWNTFRIKACVSCFCSLCNRCQPRPIPRGVGCCLTFDLQVGQRVEQRVLGHQLLVDGVLETHGAGVGARHGQIGLHGWINEQGVGWKTHKAARALGCQQSDTSRRRARFCSLTPLMKLASLTITTKPLRVRRKSEVLQLRLDRYLNYKRQMANGEGRVR